MITAQQKLNETIEEYNKKVSQVYAFKFSKSEEEMFSEIMIEFAKMHVTEALKQASESVDYELTYYYSSERNTFDKVEESILTAYNLYNIK